MPKIASKHKRNGKFRVGQSVYVNFGGKKHRATIVEDRGNVGMGGRHILRIMVHSNITDDVVEPFEVPVAELLSN